jgi:hypothetical protein
LLPAVFCCISLKYAVADEPSVKFDVPALIAVHEIEFAEGHSPGSSQKTIELVIPVTSEIRSNDRDNVDEFRFDVFWNRNVYPLADYAPKTQTVSDIEGLISVEKSQDKNAGIGINLSSGYQDVVSGQAKLDLSQRTGSKLSYQEIPQFEVLVASGTIQRSTGAFFRFHPSKRETLEGGRDLIVAYRVPQSWRGGVITVECRAEGHRKIIGSWRDPFEESRAFVLPIYLEGDDQARKAAEDFVRSEQGLRKNWQRHVDRNSPNTLGLLGLSGRPNPLDSNLPKNWVHYLIQSGQDDYLTRYRSNLPESVADAADRFVSARHDLFQLSR